jgi:8-oxo-dGTP pyrophosphatase MutT (NUDIX family)
MNFHRIKEIIKCQHTLPPEEWKGAVLFLCNEDEVFFIKRSETMPTHSGQIAFFGGHKRPDEDDPWGVAQREFEEETHLSRSFLEFMGFLPTVMTARNQAIVPVLARLNMPTAHFLKEIKSNGEWDDIIVYPWEELTQEQYWEFAWRHGHGRAPVMFHTIRAGSFLPLERNFTPHILWGATASVVWNFLRLYFKG